MPDHHLKFGDKVMNTIKMIHADYIKAGAPETTPQELAVLSMSLLPSVRRRVAENENTPADILERLSYDVDSDVRIAVGLNKTVSENVIAQLVNDEDDDVRLWLASVSYLPEKFLQQLSEDENPHIAQQAYRMIRARNDAIARIIVSFEFFSDDHSKVISTLQEIIEQHKNWPPAQVIEKTTNVLDEIRKHLARAKTMCLGWLDNMRLDQSEKHDVFKRSIADETELLGDVSDLIGSYDCVIVPVERLSTLLERVKAHKELHENELFAEIKKHSLQKTKSGEYQTKGAKS